MSTLYVSGAEILKAYSGDKIVYGSDVDVPWLCFDVVLTKSNTVRLINPLSHPKYAWENVPHHLLIDWGDGHVVKWYSRIFNSGRFNRDSEFSPTHTYDDKYLASMSTAVNTITIRVKCREPLVPIFCQINSMYGSFPPDDYIIKSSMDPADEPYEVSLFSEKSKLNDYPEHRLLAEHKSTIQSVGADLIKYWENTSMAYKFQGFTKLTKIPDGFFDGILNKVTTYSHCFDGCENLVIAPEYLLGKVNRKVTDTSYMFYNCINMTGYPGVDSAPYLKNIDKMYMGCVNMVIQHSNIAYWNQSNSYYGQGNLHYSDCPELISAIQTFDGCKSITNDNYWWGCPLDDNLFKTSTKMKYLRGCFRGSGMSFTVNMYNYSRQFKISHMLELEDCSFMMAGCLNVGTVYNGFMGDAGKNAPTFKFTGMFMEAKHVVLQAKAFSGLANRTNIVKECGFVFSGTQFDDYKLPDDLFKDVFTTPNTTLTNFFAGAQTPEINGDYIYLFEFGKLFPGCTGVVDVSYMFSDIGYETRQTRTDYKNFGINYVHPEIFADMKDLVNVEYLFSNSVLEMKVNERLFENNTKISTYYGMFDGAHVNFDMPIDYIVSTNDPSITYVDLRDMFRDSNIRTYRPFKVTSSKTCSYAVTNMLDNSATTVPMEYIMNGRLMNTHYEYTPVESCVIFRVCSSSDWIQVIPLEDCTFEVRFDDDTTSYSYTGNALVPMDIQLVRSKTDTRYGVNVKIYSTVAIFPYCTEVYEIDGEFPYKSLEGRSASITKEMMAMWKNVRYIGADVFGISSITDTIRLYCADNMYIHPWALKHNTRLTSMKLFDFLIYDDDATSQYGFANLRQLPRDFIINEEVLDMRDSIYYDGIMIPDTFIDTHNTVRVDRMIKSRPYVKDILEYRISPRPWTKNDNIIGLSTMLDKHFQVSDAVENVVYPVADEQETDYMILKFDASSVKDNVELVSLLGDEQYYPFSFRYRLITETQDITGTSVVNSADELANSMSGYSLYSSTTGTVLILYCKYPLWVVNGRDGISHVGGVIPEHELKYTFSELAPNVQTVDETILFRLTNSNFDNLFKDTKLICIPTTLFANNMDKITSLRYAFYNTQIREVPDYLFNNSYLDIDMSYIFANCSSLQYVRKPFCSSLQGRLKLDYAFYNDRCALVDMTTIFKDVYYGTRWYTNSISVSETSINESPVNSGNTVYDNPTDIIVKTEKLINTYDTYYVDIDASGLTGGSIDYSDVIYTGQTKINTISNITALYKYLPVVTRVSMNTNNHIGDQSTDRVTLCNPRLRELNYAFAGTVGDIDTATNVSPIVFSFDSSIKRYYPHPIYFVNNRNLAKAAYMYSGFNYSIDANTYSFNGMDILADNRLPHINDISYMFYGFMSKDAIFRPSIPTNTYPTRMNGLFAGASNGVDYYYVDASQFAFSNLLISPEFDSIASTYLLDLSNMFELNKSIVTMPEDMKYLIKYSGTFE